MRKRSCGWARRQVRKWLDFYRRYPPKAEYVPPSGALQGGWTRADERKARRP